MGCNGNGELPVTGGPRTHARAAAPKIGVGTGARGVAALGCSCDTDPIKVLARSRHGLSKVESRSQKGVSKGLFGAKVLVGREAWEGELARGSASSRSMQALASDAGGKDKSSNGGASKLVSGLVSGVSIGVETADCRGSATGR